MRQTRPLEFLFLNYRFIITQSLAPIFEKNTNFGTDLKLLHKKTKRPIKTGKKTKHFFPIAMETELTNTSEPENDADLRTDRFDYHFNFYN